MQLFCYTKEVRPTTVSGCCLLMSILHGCNPKQRSPVQYGRGAHHMAHTQGTVHAAPDSNHMSCANTGLKHCNGAASIQVAFHAQAEELVVAGAPSFHLHITHAYAARTSPWGTKTCASCHNRSKHSHKC